MELELVVINISPTPFEDMSFDNPELIFSANVEAYTGLIDAVELYYDIGDGYRSVEMDGQGFDGNYSTALTGLYNGMIVRYYIQAVNSEGIVETFPSIVPDNAIMFTIGDLPDLYFTDFEHGPTRLDQ